MYFYSFLSIASFACLGCKGPTASQKTQESVQSVLLPPVNSSTLSSKSLHALAEAQLDIQPTAISSIELPTLPLLRPIPSQIRCPGKPKVPGRIFFTIDDGPSETGRPFILDAFKQSDIKITFFDSGFNLCNEIANQPCKMDMVAKTSKNLGLTIKYGHLLGTHSSSHYFDHENYKCDYLMTSAQFQMVPKECGETTDPVQNMVYGAKQIADEIKNNCATKWAAPNDTDFLKKCEKAMHTAWTYARMPCTNIWRTKSGIVIDYFWEPNPAEMDVRKHIANVMFSGKNMKCRPNHLENVPWETFGWDNNIEWYGPDVKPDYICRMVEMVENNLSTDKGPIHNGKTVVLTHDIHFNSHEKGTILRDFIIEMKLRGHRFDTIDNYDK